MKVELLIAPVGGGKTSAVLDELAQTLATVPGFPQIWVLLASTRQEDAFRERLFHHLGGRRVYFNTAFFSFYTLYAHLLELAGKPQRELDDAARYRLLYSIVQQLYRSGQFEVCGRIADKPGFIRSVASLIDELKQNRVEPEVFQRVARHRAGKDRDLALIYAAYQDTLRHENLIDKEGEGWLALTELEADPAIGRDVIRLIVDGFDHFNPLQLALLRQLSDRAAQTTITLPTIPARETTAGVRFTQALEQITSVFGENRLTIRRLEAPPTRDRPDALQALLHHFRQGKSDHSPAGVITFIEAPDPAAETDAVLRMVKRLLLAGSAPDDILIAVRDWERYGAYLAAAARRYRLPVALHYGEPLSLNPAVNALLRLLDLADGDFRRRLMIDVLRSPYINPPGLDTTAVDLLEQVSQTQQVVSGRAAWLEAIQTASRAGAASHEDEESAANRVNPIQAEAVIAPLIAFLDAITPPTDANLQQYITWLERLIGGGSMADPDDVADVGPQPGYSVGLVNAAVHAADPAVAARDAAALRQLQRILRSFLSAQTLMRAIRADTTTNWLAFKSDLNAAVAAAAVERAPNRAGRVLVTAVVNARGLAHQHIIIPGLSEGIFPAPAPQDSLYLDSERDQLSQAGVPLKTSAARAADDGLFYELVGLARQTLTLSRPTVQDGAFWPASHLWRHARDVFHDVESCTYRLKPGATVSARDAATLDEAALAAAALDPTALTPDDQTVINWLAAQGDLWSRIQTARQIELSRMIAASPDRYSGRLSDPDLVAWVGAHLGPDYVWSASQFNELGMCGFRFFARRLLGLEALPEPEEGTDALQFGTLNHEILEKTYLKLAEQHLTITPAHQQTALAILDQTASEILSSAPERFGFRESALWPQEQARIREKLRRLLVDDFNNKPFKSKQGQIYRQLGEAALAERRPYRLEASFGDQADFRLKLDSPVDAVRARGKIDRMDWLNDQIVIIDYKTSSDSIDVRQMQRGRNFQMLVYLKAAQQLLKTPDNPGRSLQVVGGFFWHISSSDRQISGFVTPDHPAVKAAIEHLTHKVAQARAGNFATEPVLLDEGKCSKHCEFNQLCRISTTRRSQRDQGA